MLAETKSAAAETAAFDVPGCTAAAVARPLLRCRRVIIAVCDDFGSELFVFTVANLALAQREEPKNPAGTARNFNFFLLSSASVPVRKE